MKSEKEIKAIFKQLYSTLIDEKFSAIPDDVIVKIAIQTVAQFAKNHSVKVEYSVQ